MPVVSIEVSLSEVMFLYYHYIEYIIVIYSICQFFGGGFGFFW